MSYQTNNITKMSSLHGFGNFLLFWILTLFYGICALVYLVFIGIINKLKKKNYIQEAQDLQVLPPPCLGDTSLGHHRFHKSQGVKLHYVERGDKTRPLVLLVHGHPDFWFSWRKQIPFLATHFWVVAVDLRGCGDSETPSRRKNYKKEVIIKDLVSLIVGLGREEVFVVCDAESCDLGWTMVSHYPQMVTKLVLINGPHPYVLRQLFHFKKTNYFKFWYLLFLQIPVLPERLLKVYSPRLLQYILDPQMKANAVTQEDIKAYVYAFSRKDWTGTLYHLRQIDLAPVKEDIPPSLISTPTLILVGDSHPYLTSEDAYRSAEFAERIKVRVISGGGRGLPATHFKEVNRELTSFLASHMKLKETKETSPSLVGRVFGAVTSTYTRTTEAVPLRNGLKCAAQSTLSSGYNLAQTIWTSP